MSESIDKLTGQKEDRTALVDFYRERLLPLADLARERGIVFFPMHGDHEEESYFRDRENDGDYIHSTDASAIADELRKMWDNDEIPEIADLAEPLAELARTLHEKEPVSDEVSPFIYAMF